MRYLAMLLFLLTGCIYQMPKEGHIATSPNVNNPQFTGEKPKLPGRQ